MIKRVAQRLAQMEESATLRMAQLARDVAAQGHPVISLSLGEPDFDTPQHIKDAAIRALQTGCTKYTPVAGLPQLRQAVCHKFKRDNNLDYSPDQIVVSNGAKQAIANLSMALLEEGDEAIILSPYWVSYKEILNLSGASVKFVSAGIEQDFKVSAEQLKAAISDKTRLLIYSSPCNPTGSLLTKEELASWVEVLKEFPNLIIVSDEIYEYINFSGEAHASMAQFDEIKEQVVIVNGFSKGFAMTGWRLGYMAAPKWIADACIKIQGQFTSGANSFGQMAAAYALEAEQEATLAMRAAFERRRNLLIELLRQIPGFKVNKPQGAFYLFPDVSALFGKSYGKHQIQTDEDLVLYLLETAHVALVGGSAFGNANCLRLSYALGEDDLKEACRRIAEACEKLK
ncbi:pyridoxal phosphate-dependent aminotransferase [Saprospira sp. CCB-QB6]|uniref:pyridoxal phosphate-dependent aminotransferase n=1 Tax=Saprospira sp. CCB-QB6 TaxID=3023936 RepID=UPI002349E853|nr:pyridoxal phosphate-dependent aminotransferase [Saprospira sp. CCB-QB6]WCL81600.1 pyridoxal phosphate-dependent aminotransferase [Saprospira sp. CCB-QB6]